MLAGHAILIGYGDVGAHVAAALRAAAVPYVVVEDETAETEGLGERGTDSIQGQGSDPAVMDRANLAHARWMILTIPDAFEVGRLLERAKTRNPAIRIIAYARSADQRKLLRSFGADVVLAVEDEIARGIVRVIAADTASSPDGPADAPGTEVPESERPESERPEKEEQGERVRAEIVPAEDKLAGDKPAGAGP